MRWYKLIIRGSAEVIQFTGVEEGETYQDSVTPGYEQNLILNPNGDFGNEFIEVNDVMTQLLMKMLNYMMKIGYTRKITNNHVTGTAF